MKGEKPASCLVNTFGNIIGREHFAEIFLVLKRIMGLGIGHGSGIEPNIDKVGLAEHLLP